MRNFLVIILLSFLLSSCVVTGKHYIRNFTNDTVQVLLLSNESFSFSADSTFAYPFADQVLDIGKGIDKSLIQNITAEFISEDSLKINLPPTSTAYIGDGSSVSSYQFGALVYKLDGQTERIELQADDERVKTKRRGAGVGRYFAYIDIK